MSGAVPPPAARPLERAARVPRPVCPGCGRCGRVGPAPAPHRAPLRAGVARCGGGRRASPGGVPSTVVRGAWCQALSLPRPPVLLSGLPGFRYPCVPGAVDAGVWTLHRPHSVRPCGTALLAVGVAEGRPRGGVPSTVVRGAWCQALSLPRPPVLWSGQPGFRCACVFVCVLCLAGSGGPASRARSGAPHLFLWPLCLSALLGPLRAGVAPLSLAAVAVPRCPGAFFWLLFFFSASCCLALRALAPGLCLPLGRWLLVGGCSRGFCRSCLVPGCFSFFFSSFLFLRAPPLSPAFSGFRPPVPWASALALFALLACRFSALRALVPLSGFPPGCWLLPGGCCPPPPLLFLAVFVAAARCCVPCCAVRPWVRRCAALLRVVSPGLVLSCAVLRSFGAAACCAVPYGAARRPGFLCSAALCFAVFPRAVCVLSWRGGACCCSPLCFVLCVSRGAVLCVPCALCSVRCCASLCWCARVVLFVWCVLLLAPGAVVRCCVLCCFLWCAVVGCWVCWPVVVCWWRVSVSVSLSGRVVCFPVVGVVCCGALPSCVVFCGAVLSRGAVLLCSAVVLRCCWGLLCPPVGCRAVLCCAVGWLCCFLPGGGVCVLWCSFPRAVRSLSSPLCALRCLVVLAVVPCFPVSCAVALCCRVVLCCRALLSLCGAVCVCFALLRPVVRRLCGLRCCWSLVLWRVPVRCGVSLGVPRCGGAALVCRGVLLCCALSCGVLRPVPCPAVPCCPAVLCWFVSCVAVVLPT